MTLHTLLEVKLSFQAEVHGYVCVNVHHERHASMGTMRDDGDDDDEDDDEDDIYML